MTLLHRLASIVRWMVGRERAEAELDEELRAFLDASIAEKVRDGLSPAAARRLAMIELGGVEQTKERVRTGRHGAWLDEAGRDLRFAMRTFARSPGFAAAVVLTLALGIGANTSIFSLVDALMLRWLPVRDPQELVQITMVGPGPDPRVGAGNFSYTIVRAFAERTDIFSGVAGFARADFAVGYGGAVARVPGAFVTGGYYDTLGLAPATGRLLTPADDRREATPVAVISDGYWERQFGRDRSAIGRTLLINGAPVPIVGVSPPGFVGATVGAIADITLPTAALSIVAPENAALLERGNFWLRAIARPAPAVSPTEAQIRLTIAWSQLWASLIPESWPANLRTPYAQARIELIPGGTGWTALRDIYRTPLMLLMAIVALVLLIACANVASLMLARSSARQREIGVRLALGAGPTRIVRHLLAESVLLSLAGAACAIAIAWATSRLLVTAISTSTSQAVFDLTPNWRVLGFTAAIAIAAGILSGLAPIVHVAGAPPSAALREDARTGLGRSRLLSSLVVSQVAMSLLLLFGAALFVHTLRNLQQVDAGFRHEGVLLVPLAGAATEQAPKLLDDVRAIPGVVSASLSTHTPLSGSVWSDIAVPRGQPLPDRDTAWFVGASPRFFETMATPLVAGREFTERDGVDAPSVAIVSEAYARRFFPDRNPVGEYLSAVVRGNRRDLEIVGVAHATSAAGLRRPAPAMVYVPLPQLQRRASEPGAKIVLREVTLEARVRGSVAQVAAAMRDALQPQLPTTPVEIVPLTAQVDSTMVRERALATLATAFGALALLLACVGLYGLLAYTVARREREIGVRIALGARHARVVGMVLAGAVKLVVAGMLVGAPLAWVASRWVKSMLFGLTPGDPATATTAVGVLMTAALLAAYIPARRAARVDPLIAIRHE